MELDYYSASPRAYGSTEYYEEEKRNRLAKSWIFFCHESQLQRVGDMVTQSVMDTSVVVRRGRDNTLRAFHNICRHRGGPVMWDGDNHNGPLRCRYHGWSYDDNGQLVSAPGFFGRSEKMSPAGDYNLFQIRVETWQSLVFLNFDPDAPALVDLLSQLPTLLAEHAVCDLRPRGNLSFEFNCNWKLYVENWLESYHLPWLHQGLSRDVRVSEYQVAVRDGLVVHTAPQVDASSVYEGLWVWIPFTTGLNVYPDGLSVERILPMGPGMTRVDYLFLFDEDTTETALAATLAMCDRVTREDGQACEATHRNIRQGLFRSGPLSPIHETGIHFMQSICSVPDANSFESTR